MNSLENMNVFSDNQIDTSKPINSLKPLKNSVFGDVIYMQRVQGFDDLNLDNTEEVIDFAKRVKQLKGFNVLQNLINVMQSHSVWNSVAFLEIADQLCGDTESNDLLYYNCIQPITKAILTTKFNWDYFRKAYLFYKDVAKTCKIFDLTEEELMMCLKDVEDGISVPLAMYSIKKYGEKAAEHAERFKDMEDYMEARKSLYFTEFPEVVDKFIGNVPNEVLSTILVFAKAGEDLNPLNYYESKFKKFDYWRKSFGFQKVMFEDEIITKDHATNILAMYQILHGDLIELYGNEPIKNMFIDKVLRYLKEDGALPYSVREEPLSEDRSVYFVNADISLYRFCDTNFPYIAKRVESKIESINKNMVKDCKVDWRAFSGHKNTTLLVTYKNTKEYAFATDKFRAFGLTQVFPLLPLNKVIELLKSFTSLGNQLKCYDPVLLFSVHVLMKSEIEVSRWCQLYITDPLIFTYCFCRAITGYLLGADDYKKLFTLDSPHWYEVFKKIAFLIRENYNLAATCFNYLLFKADKTAYYADDVNLDYDFPSEILVRDRTGKETKIYLYDVLNNPEQYVNVFKKGIIGDVMCSRNNEGTLVVTPKLGGVINA